MDLFSTGSPRRLSPVSAGPGCCWKSKRPTAWRLQNQHNNKAATISCHLSLARDEEVRSVRLGVMMVTLVTLSLCAPSPIAQDTFSFVQRFQIPAAPYLRWPKCPLCLGCTPIKDANPLVFRTAQVTRARLLIPHFVLEKKLLVT